MKKLKRCLNKTGRPLPLMDKDGRSERFDRSFTVGPEYYETRQFRSLVASGRVQVLREDTIPEPKLKDPKASKAPVAPPPPAADPTPRRKKLKKGRPDVVLMTEEVGKVFASPI